MSFLKKLAEFFGGGGSSSQRGYSDPNGLYYYFRCGKCGAPVKIRVDKRNDVNRHDGEGPGVFVLRKEVMDAKCFQIMHAEFYLDASYNLVTADVTGGEMMTADEYEAAMQPAAADESGESDE